MWWCLSLFWIRQVVCDLCDQAVSCWSIHYPHEFWLLLVLVTVVLFLSSCRAKHVLLIFTSCSCSAVPSHFPLFSLTPHDDLLTVGVGIPVFPTVDVSWTVVNKQRSAGTRSMCRELQNTLWSHLGRCRDGKSKEIYRWVYIDMYNISREIYRYQYISKEIYRQIIFFLHKHPSSPKHFPHQWQFFYLRKRLKASKTK